MGLERVKKWLYATDLKERGTGCTLCGSCYGHGPSNPFEDEPGPKTKCPPYEFYRFQRFTPKSRWLLSQRVYHGLDPITPELKEVMYTCTSCLLCDEICGVRDDGGPWDITRAMREEIVEKEGPLEAHRPLLTSLKTNDNPWSYAKKQRGDWAQGLTIKRIGAEKASTLLFAGCSTNQPSGRSEAVSLAKIMQHVGEDFGILGESEKCCGLYAKDLGDRKEYDRLERENLQMIREAGVKKVVVACGSCLRVWKEYPKAMLAGVEVMHGVEYLAEKIKSGKIKFPKTTTAKVTYHDPCHLGRGCGVYEPPRTILKAIPGIELVEMPRHGRWAWCCAGGAGILEAFPDFARWGREDRLKEASQTGAALLLTTSALCLRNLTASNKNPSSPQVQGLLDFVCQSLGL